MKKLKAVICILFIAFLVLSTADPVKLMHAAYNGLTLWAVRVVPSLFPFLFAARALLLLGADTAVNRLLSPLLHLLGFPRRGAYPFLVSVLCGYPSGAKTLGDMYRDGLLSCEECSALAPLCHTSGPVFVLGYAAGVTGSDGGMLLLCHIGGVLCSCCILRAAALRKKAPAKQALPNKGLSNTGLPPADSSGKYKKTVSAGTALGQACSSAVSSMLTVGGFIVFFCCVNAFVSEYIGKAGALLEMTYGLSMQITPPQACFLLSFSGLCIIAQALSFLPEGINKTGFILSRILAGLLSYTFCAAAMLTSAAWTAAIICTLTVISSALCAIWRTARGSSLPARRCGPDNSQAPPAHRLHKP